MFYINTCKFTLFFLNGDKMFYWGRTGEESEIKGGNSLTSINSVSWTLSCICDWRISPAPRPANPTDMSSQTPSDEDIRWTLCCHHTEKFVQWYSAQYRTTWHLFSYQVPLKLLCPNVSNSRLWHNAQALQIWVINSMQHSKLAFFSIYSLGISFPMMLLGFSCKSISGRPSSAKVQVFPVGSHST